MHEKIKKLSERIDRLQHRERLLLFITLIVVLMFVWDTAILRDQLDERSRINSQNAEITPRLQAETARQQALTASLSQDPNQREKARLERYTAEISGMEATLKTKTVEFISPRQMVEVLENLIRREPGLQLVSLETLPPETSMFSIDASATDTPEKTLAPLVYLHGLEMEFRGDYFSVLNYVRHLESLTWRFGWSSLEIRMDKYPASVVKVRLETMSLTEGWIGV
jgi:MSHA biogenesis protein MshJ